MGLGVDARYQERLARHEADGTWRIVKDAAFAGGKACSTTAEAGRVHAIPAVSTWGLMTALICGCEVTRYLMRGACGERRNVSSGSDTLAHCRSLPGKTNNGAARDQEDHGQQ